MHKVLDFVPYRPIITMMDPGTRVMIFQEDDGWLAHGVDVSACTQASSLEGLSDSWETMAIAYKELSDHDNPRWEPPMGYEMESVWESGSPFEFIKGIDARITSYEIWMTAYKEYHKRYKSYGLGLTKEEQEEWDRTH